MNYTLSDFAVGQRVELHSSTDAWMRGDRFGEVRSIGRTFLHVAMDRSGRTVKIGPWDISRIMDRP